MIEWIKYGFWNFGNADFSHGLNGMVGQVTHCKADGIEFWTRENTNGVPTFLISSAERWGEKAGATPRKDRHTALYFALFDFILASVKLVKDAEDGDGYHKCPYCDAKHGQINDHFSHIEFSHPGKPLI